MDLSIDPDHRKREIESDAKIAALCNERYPAPANLSSVERLMSRHRKLRTAFVELSSAVSMDETCWALASIEYNSIALAHCAKKLSESIEKQKEKTECPPMPQPSKPESTDS